MAATMPIATAAPDMPPIAVSILALLLQFLNRTCPVFFFEQGETPKGQEASLVKAVGTIYKQAPKKRKSKAGLKYYNEDPEENCRNAIESFVAAADLRPPTSGVIVAAGDLATWGVDGVASWSGVGEVPHTEEG
jgi:hypothetical protein